MKKILCLLIAAAAIAAPRAYAAAAEPPTPVQNARISGNSTIGGNATIVSGAILTTSGTGRIGSITGNSVVNLANPGAGTWIPVFSGNTASLVNPASFASTAGLQLSDAELTALAAISTTGLYAVTGAGTGAVRTITAPAAGISVTNGDGVAGNPTLALTNDLAALEGLSTVGIVIRSATDMYVTRNITAPAAGITFTNPNGASGNITLALANDLAAIEGLSGTGIIVRNATDSAATRTLTGGTGITVTNGDGVSGNPTVTLAITTSAHLAGNLSDETGTGAAVFATGAALTNATANLQPPDDISGNVASTLAMRNILEFSYNRISTSDWTCGNVSNGVSTANATLVMVKVTTSGNGSAYAKSASPLFMQGGIRFDSGTNWGRAIRFSFNLAPGYISTNGVGRVTLGKLAGSSEGALAVRGIGFKFTKNGTAGYDVYGILHDGTTGNDASPQFITTVATGNDLLGYHFVAYSNGSGTVTWYVGDGTTITSVSASGGPTGGGGVATVWAEITAGGDTPGGGGSQMLVNNIAIQSR